ncbi:MAG: thioredoxin TrxC [Magnetococcus sp. WYHC-3]
MSPILQPCPRCRATNRIPLAKADAAALCGLCRTPLPPVPPGRPVSADDSSFSWEVLQAPLPVLVDFWAPWCAPCRQIAPVLESLAGEFRGRLKVVKINTDLSQKKAEEFQVRSIPTLMLFSAGRSLASHAGVLPLPQLRQWITTATGLESS